MRLKSSTISPVVAISIVIGTISILVATAAAKESTTGSEPTTANPLVVLHGTVTQTDGNSNLGLQKMIGVDFRPDGHSRMDQQQQQHFWTTSSETEKNDDKTKGGEQTTELLSSKSTKKDECLIFMEEFDTLDNSVWKVTERKSGFAPPKKKTR